jgi:cobyrinic acid a,c-diamide synthase
MISSNHIDIPKIVVAGATSGVGKSSVAIAVMYALKEKGYKVQPFKVGPDFIDPSYHSFVTGRLSRNLDIWLMRKSGVLNCFYDSCYDADIAVIEGVMGYFDGISGRNDHGSTAHIARILDAKVLLVIDAAKGARSLAATALGFIKFSKTRKIHGIILNNVGSSKHEAILREAFADKVKVPIMGIIRRNSEITMPERRLGLTPTAELDNSNKKGILMAARYIANQINLEKIMDLVHKPSRTELGPPVILQKKEGPYVAVALDQSFNFYYADNLDALRKEGINLIFFSPIQDGCLPPNISGIILGGGFPEILAKKLSKNQGMKSSILEAAQTGTPVYAECGGLMYLSRSIMEDDAAQFNRGYPKSRMVGLIDVDTIMTGRLTLGYTIAECESPPFKKMLDLRGHEFHYSKVENVQCDAKFAYRMIRGSGVDGQRDGFMVYDCLASYMHLHFSDARLPRRLAKTFRKFRK